MKIKESEKINKYVDLAEEMKKLWNMKVTVISSVGVPHGTVYKGLEKRFGEQDIRGRVKIIETTSLLKSARTLRSARQTSRDLRHSDFRENHQLRLV